MSHSYLQENFVNERLCAALQEMGLVTDTPCRFRWYPGCDTPTLYSIYFDPLELYGHSALIGKHLELPAYTVSDMLICIPDFALCRLGNIYQVCPGAWLRADMEEDVRLADAAAKLLLQLLRKGRLSVEKCNTLLTDFNPIKN